MAYTCICILAVDFHAFPRRYAKTETYGTGLMDVGVGAIIFASGLVSKAAQPSSSTGQGGRPPSVPLLARCWRGVHSAALCWALGLGRLLATKALNYQEHVGEYGAQWNFFTTIAVVTLLGHVVQVAPERLVPLALLVTAAHQAALTAGGLAPWALSPPGASRDLVSLNKEGLVSCAGYWALYLWGAALGHAMHLALQRAASPLRSAAAAPANTGAGTAHEVDGARESGEAATPALGGAAAAEREGNVAPAEGRRRQQPAQLRVEGQQAGLVRVEGGRVVAGMVSSVGSLALAAAACWAATWLLEWGVERVSRRLCNAAYIMWTCALTITCLLPLLVTQWLLLPARCPSSPPSVADAASTSSTPRPQATGATQGESLRAWLAAWALQRGTNGSDGGGSRSSVILLAINRHMLPVFLLANLLTGTVNLSVNTLTVPDWAARCIVGAYITVVCGAAIALDALRQRPKQA